MAETTRPGTGRARRTLLRAAVPVVVPVAALAAVLGGGGASAYWTEAGGGTGSSGTAVATTVTLTPGVVTASLHPGSAGTVAVEASNPGTAEVVVTALGLDTAQGSLGIAVDADHPACPATAFTFATQDNAGSGWTVPGASGATAGRLAITLPQSLTLATDAPDGCQGAVVTVFLRSV